MRRYIMSTIGDGSDAEGNEIRPAYVDGIRTWGVIEYRDDGTCLIEAETDDEQHEWLLSQPGVIADE